LKLRNAKFSSQKGDKAMNEKSIELLNKAVADELSAVHQYMFFHFHCEKQGNELLSRLFWKTAVQEMRHVERCAKRILFLDGEVDMTASNSVQKIHDVKVMLEMACKMEQGSITDYNQWASECSTNSDSGSRKVFKGLVKDEEQHYNQYGLELEKIN
jgi:bacterioferritin